jgi:hypothetical protein
MFTTVTGSGLNLNALLRNFRATSLMNLNQTAVPTHFLPQWDLSLSFARPLSFLRLIRTHHFGIMGVQHCRWHLDQLSGHFKDLLTIKCTFNGYCLFQMMNVKKERARGNWPSHWDHGKNQCWQVTAFLSTRLVRLFKNNSGFIFPFFPNVVPIAPYFNPICFDKCCPPSTYMLEPKGKDNMFDNKALW